MSDPKDTPIYIHEIIGGDSGKALIDCWFIRHGNTYSFYDKDGTEKASDVKVGESFPFTLDGMPDVDWTLAITNPVGPDKLRGTWTNTVDPTLADGEYQAQAGGTGEEEGEDEDTNAASAGGYVA